MDVGIHLLWNSFFKLYINSWALTAAVETDSTAIGMEKLLLDCLLDRKWLNLSSRKWPPLTLTPFHIRTPPPASQKPQTHTLAHTPPCGSRVGLRCWLRPLHQVREVCRCQQFDLNPVVFLPPCTCQLPATSARDAQQQSTLGFFFLIHSTELFKNNEVMPFLTAPDADVMNISFFPCLNQAQYEWEHQRGILSTDTDHSRTSCLDWISYNFIRSYFLFKGFLFFFLRLALKGLTGCEFLIANSQDPISCNSNQGHLRWAYACLPPWPTALKGSLCCGLPSLVTWLLWKCPLPPPPSLFPVNCLKGGGWVRVKPASL